MSVVERTSRRIARELGFNLRRVIAPGAASANMLAEVRDLVRSVDPATRDFIGFCLPRLMLSRAQILQDLFALYQTGEKRGGFFVEFGATDGVTGSNSHMLETHYGWTGIVAEPARGWHEALDANRHCIIDHRCVSGRSGDLVMFNQAPNLELSTIDRYADTDGHAASRRRGERYPVETVSLDDLLEQHGAPADIDYLSVDTEGSELAILSNFDFARFRPRVITVEHNFSPNRAGLFTLLTCNGYDRLSVDISQMDDWYVRR